MTHGTESALKDTNAFADCVYASDYLRKEGYYAAADVLLDAARLWMRLFIDRYSSEGFDKPFSHNGYIYATDRRIVVRVRSSVDLGSDGLSRDHLETIGKMFIDFFGEYGFCSVRTWLEWPTNPVEMEISKEDSGKECPICFGEGYYASSHGDAVCVYCDGDGVVSRYIRKELDDQSAVVSGKYWDLVRRLPDAMYVQPETEQSAIPFQFRYGQGLLMPMKTD